MGRAGRYTLAVMAWVAAYALWSGLLGLLVAAVTGERLGVGDAVQSEVPAAVSALFFVLLPGPPTVVALWFNDWARDGFPSKAARADRAARGDAPSAPEPEAASETAPRPEPEPEPVTPPRPPRAATGPQPAGPAAAGVPRVVPPVPLGVPERAGGPSGSEFPVAPLLRD